MSEPHRRVWRSALALLAISSAIGCVQRESPHPIPDGVYRSAAGNEQIAIAGKRIHFVLQGTDRSASTVEKEYNYTAYPSGRVELYPMTSADALSGPVGRYEWSWDGTVISRRDARNVEPTVSYSKE